MNPVECVGRQEKPSGVVVGPARARLRRMIPRSTTVSGRKGCRLHDLPLPPARILFQSLASKLGEGRSLREASGGLGCPRKVRPSRSSTFSRTLRADGPALHPEPACTASLFTAAHSSGYQAAAPADARPRVARYRRLCNPRTSVTLAELGQLGSQDAVFCSFLNAEGAHASHGAGPRRLLRDRGNE